MMKQVFKRLLLAALFVAPWATMAQLSLPVTMDFESGMGSWTMANTAGNTGMNTSEAHTGSGCFQFYYNTNPPQYLFSPELSPLTAPAQVEFWYKVAMSYYAESFVLGWSSTTNDPSAFTWGTEMTNLTNTSYQKYEDYVPAGTKYICIKYTANDKYVLYIDDIVIQDPPTCLPVSGLTTTAADSNSITLSWTDEMNTGASYSVAYWTTSDTTWLTATDTFLTVTGLDASTAYHFLVRATCSATDSSAAVSGTFRTECGGITLPYTVDFEDAAYNGAWYPCWDSVIHAGSDPSVNDQNSPANHTPDGTYAMYLQGNSSQPYNLVVSPRVPLPGDQIFVSFWARRASNCWIKAGVITNPHDTSTFIPLAEVGSNSWEEYTFSTAGLDPNATYYVAWMGYGYGYYGTTFIGKFDDVVIRQDNGCNKPNMAVVDSVGPYTAYLTWTTGGASATSYDLLYGTTNNINDAAVETVTDLNDTVHYALMGLLPQTTYYVWVRTNCGSDVADAKAFGSLTTQMTCAPVINAAMENISYTAAVINWAYDSTVGFASEGVQITLTDNTDSTVAPVVVEVTGTTYTFNGLQAGHSYTATLSNFCDAESQTDTATAVNVNFMTQSCSEVPAGEGTSNNVPMNCYYDYSYAQSVYTAVEMPNVDTIHGVAFYTTGTDTKTIEVYLGHTPLSTLSTSSYVAPDSLTQMVANYSYAFTPGWNVINFDSFFVYQPTWGNLVIAVRNVTGGWSSNRPWATHATNAAQSVYWYQDGSSIDMAAPTAISSGAGNYVAAVRFVANCEVPQCFAPMLSLGAVDSTSISVNWVSVGTENEWAVGIKADGATGISWAAASVTDTFYTFSNLNANTRYTVYVGSLCNGDTLLATVVAKTACGAMSLPYSTGFEADVTNETPSCWTVVNGYTASVWDYSTYSYVDVAYPSVSTGAHTGSKSLGFVSDNVSTLIASSALPSGATSMVVGFWAQTDDYYGYATPVLEAGLMTDLTEDTTFVPMVTITGGQDYAYYEFVTPTLASDSTYYLAFRYNCTDQYGYYSSESSADVDDINIRLDDGCHRPTNVVAYGTDTNNIAVSWTDDGIVNNYTVRYRVKGTNTWSSVDGLAITNTDLTNLATATAYEIIVGTACSTDTLWADAVTTRTMCAPMVLPYSTSFENDVVGEMPACWNNSGATGYYDYYGIGYPSVDNGYNTEAHTGDKALTFYYFTGTSIVSSDPVPLAGDSIYVSFWGMIEGSSYYGNPTMEAGVMTNPAIDSTFIPLVTVAATDYQRYEFNTNTLSHDSTYYVAFRYTTSYEYNEAFIDDINISLDEGCHYPGNLTATASGDTIVLSWDSTGTANNFVVQYRAVGSSWSNPQAVTGLADTLTGLAYATAYEIRVGNACGSDTLWVTTLEQTPCALLPTPYFEDFDSYATDEMPPCWGWSSTSATHDDGGVFLKAYHGGGSEYVVVPQVDGAITKLKVEFDAKVGTPAENDGILIGVADENGTWLSWLDTIQDPNFSRNNHVHKTVYFPNYTMPMGAARVCFAQLRNWYEWALLDNISIEVLPDCYPVDDLTGHNLDDPEASNFTWTPVGNETAWQVYVDTVTVDIDSLDNISASNFIDVTTPAYTIPVGMIQGGGIYNFFVRSNCGTSQSTWVKSEFGAGTIIMDQSNDTVTGCGFVVYDNGGPIAGYLANTNSTLVLRTENVGSQLKVFGGKFGFGSSPATLTVYDGESTNGTALFTYATVDGRDTLLDTILAVSTTGSLTINFTVSGTMCHTGYELYVRCTDGAVCPRPTELQATMTAPGTADITWTGTASSYNLYYRLSGTDAWVQQTVGSNSYTLTGLMPDTVYDMYVVALCSATDSSTASVVRHLNTHYQSEPEECETPTDLAVSNITITGAVASWTSPAGANLWEVELTSADGPHTFNATQTSYTFNGLADSTQYRVRVRTVCDETDGLYSDWSDYVDFTTRHQHSTEGIDDVVGTANFMLYPNPASTTVTLDLRAFDGTTEVSIIDQSGRTVFSRKAEGTRMTVDVAGYTRGAYFVRVTSSKASAIRKLVVK